MGMMLGYSQCVVHIFSGPTLGHESKLFICTHPGQFHIKNVSPTEEGEASKVKVKVRVNIHGVFFIKSATMVEHQKQEEAMETEPAPQPQAEASQGASQNASGEKGEGEGMVSFVEPLYML